MFTAAWCPGLEITEAERNAGAHYPHSRKKTGLRRSLGYFGQLGSQPSVVWSHHRLPAPGSLRYRAAWGAPEAGTGARHTWVQETVWKDVHSSGRMNRTQGRGAIKAAGRQARGRGSPFSDALQEPVQASCNLSSWGYLWRDSLKGKAGLWNGG